MVSGVSRDYVQMHVWHCLSGCRAIVDSNRGIWRSASCATAQSQIDYCIYGGSWEVGYSWDMDPRNH